MVLFNDLEDEVPKRSYFYQNHKKELQDIENEKPIDILPDSIIHRKVKGKTCLLITGTLKSRLKASLQVSDLPLYFDVMCRESVIGLSFDSPVQNIDGQITKEILKKCEEIPKLKEFIRDVRNYKDNLSIKQGHFISKKVYNVGFKKYPYHLGYRFVFDDSKEREKYIKKAYDYKRFFVTSDSIKPFETMFSKHEKTCGNWIRITDYESEINMSPAKYNYEDEKLSLDDKWSYKTKADVCFRTKFKYCTNPEEPIMNYPNIICSMDIETCNITKEITMKTMLDESNVIFNITCYVTDGDRRLNINIYFTRDGKYHPELGIKNAFNICCNSEKQVVKAYCIILEKIQPDIIMHYNGNLFDIPLILLKLRQYNIFDEMFCRTSLDYLDSYNTDNLVELDGNFYQRTFKPPSSTVWFTYWNKVYTNSDVSGLNGGNSKKLSAGGRVKTFKFDATTSLDYHYWSPFGSITVDLYMHCATKYKKEPEKNMNAFLRKNKIGLKDDLDYAEIWRRWLNNDIDKLSEIFKYCLVDSMRCYQLSEAELYLQTNREFAQITGMSFFDTIYQAGTSKVRAQLYEYAFKNGFVGVERKFRRTEEMKYLDDYHIYPERKDFPGGYVHIHRKGKIYTPFDITDYVDNNLGLSQLEDKFKYEIYKDNDRIYAKIITPEEAVDFQSLYPSIIRSYNLSHECCTFDKNEIKGDYITIKSNDLGPDMDKDLYIKDHHGNRDEMGIFAQLESDLFVERKKAKGKMNGAYENLEKIKESTRTDFLKNNPNHGLSIDNLAKKIDKMLDSNKEYLQQRKINRAYNSKQLAIKILMNTGYGFLSYPRGMGYKFVLAYLITSRGRMLTQESNKFLAANGCIIDYNDTDSTYFTHNPKIFEDINRRYFKGEFDKKKHMEKLCKRSIKKAFTKSELIKHYENKKNRKNILNKIKKDDYQTLVDKLNNKFRMITGYGFLIMVREETLYPAVHCMDKKYFGFKHEKKYVPEPSIDDMFTRGIPVVCRNTSVFVSSVNKSLMLEILRTYKVDVKNIVYSKIKSCYHILADPNQKVYKYEDFENKQRYKYKTCANTATRVVKNMTGLYKMTKDETVKSLCIEPDILEVVRYVLCEDKKLVDLKMRKNNAPKGSRYFYTKVAKYLNEPLDHEEYVPTIFSPCAQLLTYNTDYSFYIKGIKSKVYKQLIQKELVKEFSECDDNIILSRNRKFRLYGIKEFQKLNKNGCLYRDWVNLYYTGIERSVLLFLWNCKCKDGLVGKIVNVIGVFSKNIESTIKTDIQINEDKAYKALESMEKVLEHMHEDIEYLEKEVINRFNLALYEHIEVYDFVNADEFNMFIPDLVVLKLVLIYKFMKRYTYISILCKRILNKKCKEVKINNSIK